ncbi:MAG: hypothetical protein ACE5PM_04630 [Candidatus Hydrothermarchaeales archaeon]
MKKVKYICPLCKRSSIIPTRCVNCTRMMIEVCAVCERPLKNCVCGEDLGIPSSVERKETKIIYICPGCGEVSPWPDHCIDCHSPFEATFVCAKCEEPPEDCKCEEEVEVPDSSVPSSGS